MDIAKLKAVLANELDKERTDFNEILKLANEIVKHDIDNVRFSVDASHITRLGHELVSKQETAVAELVKNAYDADATCVKVIFRNASSAGGDLIIEDDGVGMNRDHLINGFMRISTQDKSDNTKSVKYTRQRAGRKGIGRFSAQRLGRALEVITRHEESPSGLCVNIDWSKFDQATELIFISSQIKDYPDIPSGTTLNINGLKDSWSIAQIKRAYRYISDLIQPFPLMYSPEQNNKDPGFHVEFYQENDGDKVLVANEEISILSNALAVISGHVNHEGKPFISVESSRHNINIVNEPMILDERVKNVFGVDEFDCSLLAGISFKAHYFIAEDLPQGSSRIIKNILKSSGGIRIYRNGFRVLPYGEPQDDWLGLQRSSAVRVILPPHHNSNFIGFVQINDVTGKSFEETASREGLIENSAFSQLRDYVYRALANGVLKIGHARGKKLFASDDPIPKDPTDTAAQLVKKLNSIISTLNVGVLDLVDKASISELAADLVDKIKVIDQESQALLEENGMLRVLASLGLTIGEFTHETRHVLLAISARILSIVKDNSEDANLKSLRESIESLQSYLRYFDKAVTQNTQRTLSAHEVRDLIADFEEVIAPTLKRQHVNLAVEVNGYELFVKPSHRSEWASIFLNLFTNSLKAINRTASPGEVLIRAGETDNEAIYIEFIDNGDGISEQNKDKVFDAFFTTSTPADALADEEVQITGSGLGLKIIKDIIDHAGGDIFVSTPPAGYSTCIRIEFPKALDEEIPDELR